MYLDNKYAIYLKYFNSSINTWSFLQLLFMYIYVKNLFRQNNIRNIHFVFQYANVC